MNIDIAQVSEKNCKIIFNKFNNWDGIKIKNTSSEEYILCSFFLRFAKK